MREDSKKKSLFVRTTPEEHDLAEKLLADRPDVSISRMIMTLVSEDWQRRHPTEATEDQPEPPTLLAFDDGDGVRVRGKPVRIAGAAIIVELARSDGDISVRCVSANQADSADFQRAWQALGGD